MNKKVVIACVAGFAAAAAVITGIIVLIVNVLGYRSSSVNDVPDDDYDKESSYYRDDPEPVATTTRETQGRDYYENGGFKGWDNYFIIQDLTTEARNSITIEALSQGIKCWDKDIMRYVNSNDIEMYDPMDDFLEHLPKWDGKDRVEALARRVRTDYKEWPHLFHIWMRSMVAMWKGKGQLTGNALVPLLIGRQGCGKSRF